MENLKVYDHGRTPWKKRIWRAVPTFKQRAGSGTMGYERSFAARVSGGRGSDYHRIEITQPERSTARQSLPRRLRGRVSFVQLFFARTKKSWNTLLNAA